MPSKAKLTTRSTSTSTVSSDNLNKGSELTFNEADSNFLNLRDQTFGLVGDDSSGVDVESGQTITVTGTGGITVAVANDTVTIDGSAVSGGGSANLGNLQVNDTTLSPITTNDDLVFTANGTGDIFVKTDSSSLLYIGDTKTNNYFSVVPSSGMLKWNSSGATPAIFSHNNGGIVQIESITTDKIRIQPNNTNGEVIVGPTNGVAYLGSSGTNDLKLWTNSGTNSGSITITDGVNGDITISPNGTGKIVLDGLNWPTSDGTSGQYLTTNGAGVLSWSSSVVTSFGDLTAVGSTIASPSNADLTLDPSGSGKVQINSNLAVSNNLTVGNITHSTGNISRNDDNEDLTIKTSQTAATTGDVNIQGSPSGQVNVKGPVSIAFDNTDTIGSGNTFIIGEIFTRFNKGGNDIQNVMVHKNGTAGTSDALLHVETYRNMVTINDSGIAYNGSSAKFEGQGTENFNVIGTARLDNVYFKDNKIYTNRSNEDLQIATAGTGTVDFQLPTSATIGSNGAASALTANPVGYLKIKIAGTEYQIPYYNT